MKGFRVINGVRATALVLFTFSTFSSYSQTHSKHALGLFQLNIESFSSEDFSVEDGISRMQFTLGYAYAFSDFLGLRVELQDIERGHGIPIGQSRVQLEQKYLRVPLFLQVHPTLFSGEEVDLRMNIAVGPYLSMLTQQEGSTSGTVGDHVTRKYGIADHGSFGIAGSFEFEVLFHKPGSEKKGGLFFGITGGTDEGLLWSNSENPFQKLYTSTGICMGLRVHL